MTRTIYLVRHCQTSGQEPDAPLTLLGQQQAVALADCLAKESIRRIVSSPFLRAYQTAQPLAQICELKIETDERLRERTLSGVPIDNWREKLEFSFTDLDFCLPGGESSRAAMTRGLAALSDIMHSDSLTTVVVTHGNLMTLLLKSFNNAVGFAEWTALSSPDVYRIEYTEKLVCVEHYAIKP